MNGKTSAYLAHNFAARDYLRELVKPFLENNGCTVVSRWIYDDSHLLDSNKIESAVHDLEDIDKASWFILWVEQYTERPGKGKFVELGYALKAGKRIILVGSCESCIFYNLPNLIRVSTKEEILKYL